ncbi:MAG: hypothetical protein IPK68_00595 [Bdellovibrionales bacterium]|nr:hypothetical protein [Bdellovibrionales bacterium]
MKPSLYIVYLVLGTLLAIGFSFSFISGALAADEVSGDTVRLSCRDLVRETTPSSGEKPGFHIRLAMTPPVQLDSGIWSFTIDWNKEERKIELPSIVFDSLRGDPNLRIIVLAGNTLYENTRHNLGFHFGDYLIEHAGAVGATQNAQGPENGRYRVFEKLNILYDDRSARSGGTMAFSEPGTFRTPQIEIFILGLPNMQKVAILRPIGDYNEIGDVLAPVLDVTGVPINQVLLVHDDLRETESSLSFYEGPHDPKGNNAVFSINRALSFGIISRVIDQVKDNSIFGGYVDSLELVNMQAQLKQLASMREGSTAFRNLNTILIPIRKHTKNLVQEKASRLILDKLGGAELKALKRRKADLQRFPVPANFTTSSAYQSELVSLQVDIQEIESKLAIKKKSLDKAYQELEMRIERIVREGLSFNRLAIGTGAPEDMTDFVDFVLGNFPPEKFDKSFWERAWKKVSEYLQQPK